MQTAEKVLLVSDLCKSYGELNAVDRISFDVSPGEIVGLLGPNGAGKTSTINMILGVLEPDSGSIRIGGIDLTAHRSRALERTNFAAVYAPLPGNLTVSQNLRIFGLIYGVADLRARVDQLLEQFELVRFRDVRCGALSSGEQTRVSLAKAMLNSPRLSKFYGELLADLRYFLLVLSLDHHEYEDVSDLLNEHQRIVTAFASRDAEVARATIAEIITENLDEVRRILASRKAG